MQEVKYEVNQIPELIASGKMSTQKAVNKIAEIVMRNPQVFSLQNENEEVRSEVSLRIISSGESVFSHYDFSSSSFLTYLTNHIKFLILTIKRNLHNEILISKVFNSMNRLEFEDDEMKYFENEKAFSITNLVPYKLRRTEKVPFLRNTSIQRRKCNNLQVTKQDDFHLDYFREIHSSEGKVTLITALKYCFYLSDSEILKIAEFCRCNSEKLKKSCEYLISTMKNKTKSLESLKKSRNREYFLHKKYSEEIEALRINNEEDPMIRQKFENHTRLWKSRNKIIAQRISRLCPTNKKIAEILGICEREVGYYIKKTDLLEKIRNSLSKDESGL